MWPWAYCSTSLSFIFLTYKMSKRLHVSLAVVRIKERCDKSTHSACPGVQLSITVSNAFCPPPLGCSEALCPHSTPQPPTVRSFRPGHLQRLWALLFSAPKGPEVSYLCPSFPLTSGSAWELRALHCFYPNEPHSNGARCQRSFALLQGLGAEARVPDLAWQDEPTLLIGVTET